MNLITNDLEQVIRQIEEIENKDDNEITEQDLEDLRWLSAHYEILKANLN